MIKKFISRFKKTTPSRRRYAGQGMVEFALALPILLTVIYGLLETGRLLFIYSSAVTSARQAARYGSATGSNDGGTPYYRDCDGIDAAANNTAFINTFSDINVTYDRGLDDDGNVVDIPGFDSDPTADTCPAMDDITLQNGDRIKVQVTTEWSPIIAISRLIPSFDSFTITSEAERTILMEIPIGVDPDAEIWVPGGALQLTVNALESNYDAVGDVIHYEYSLYNNANFDLNGPIQVIDDTATPNCGGAPGTLGEGVTFNCTGTYTVTQEDLDRGFIANLVIAKSIETTSNQTGDTVLAIQYKILDLIKTPSTTLALTEGTVVDYTYRLENNGNVTLSAPYSVSDNKIPSVDCSGASATIAPGSFVECDATYSITAADIEDAAVINLATAQATFDSQPVTSNTAIAKVNTSPLDLDVTADVPKVNTFNQKITYTYKLTNVGSVALSPNYAITDSIATNIQCTSSDPIAPGGFTTCKGEYYVTQADLDSGNPIINVARGTSNSGLVKSNVWGTEVDVEQLPAVTVTINPPSGFTAAVGTPVVFTYDITNTGNITLSPDYAIIEQGMTETASCPSTLPLARLATTTCTLTHYITLDEINVGHMLSIANGTANTGGVTSAQATLTVPTTTSPSVMLSITSLPSTFGNTSTPLSIKFTLKNTGSSILSAPYTVSANSFLNMATCTNINTPATLAFGEEVSCTTSYTPNGTDITNGSISITATGTVNNGGSPLNSNTETLVIPYNFNCFVYHRLLTTPPPSITFPRVNQMQMSVINDAATSSTLHIQSIKLSNWSMTPNTPVNNNQYITSITFGGVQIYTGSSANRVNPFITSAPFSGNVTLNPGQTKTLLFTFNRNYNETNSEIIEITFVEAACPILDSSNSLQVK